MCRLPALPRAVGWIADEALTISSQIHLGGAFPLANLLLATGATALLIWNGEAHPLQLLSARPVVLVGLISYSLYLWH